MDKDKIKRRLEKHMLLDAVKAVYLSWEEIDKKATAVLTEILEREVHVKACLEHTGCWCLQVIDGWITQEEISNLFDFIGADDHDRDSTYFEESNIIELTEGISAQLFSLIVPFKIEKRLAGDGGVCFIGVKDDIYSKVLKRPLRRPEIIRALDEDGYIEGVISIKLSELINEDYENFLDLLADRLTGGSCLSDIEYRIVGYNPKEYNDSVYMLISGHVDDLNEDDEDVDISTPVELEDVFVFESK